MGEASAVEVFVVTAQNGLDGERFLPGESRRTCCLLLHLNLPTGDEVDGPTLRHDSTTTSFPCAITHESVLNSAPKGLPVQFLIGKEEEMEEALIKLLLPPMLPVKSAEGN
jgi:hypothetical protein